MVRGQTAVPRPPIHPASQGSADSSWVPAWGCCCLGSLLLLMTTSARPAFPVLHRVEKRSHRRCHIIPSPSRGMRGCGSRADGCRGYVQSLWMWAQLLDGETKVWDHGWLAQGSPRSALAPRCRRFLALAGHPQAASIFGGKAE